MKKSLFLFFISITSLTVSAQFPFSSYTSSYYKFNPKVKIGIRGNNYTLYVGSVAQKEDQLFEGGLIVREKQHNSFIESINMAKEKYIEFVRDANSNVDKRTDRQMRIFQSLDIYEATSQKQIEIRQDVSLDFNFFVRKRNDSTSYILNIAAGVVHVNFTNTAEIDSFLNAVSIKKANDYFVENGGSKYLKKINKEKSQKEINIEKGMFSSVSGGIKLIFPEDFSMNEYSSYEIAPSAIKNSSSGISSRFALGIFCRVPMKNFLLQSELNYLSEKMISTFKFYNSSVMLSQVNYETKISRLNIPILVGYTYRIGNFSNFNFLIGPEFNFNMKNGVEKTYVDPNILPNTVTFKTDPFKLGLTTGLEFNVRAISLSARYHLLSSSEHLYYAGGKLTPDLSANYFSFGLGVKLFQYPKL